MCEDFYGFYGQTRRPSTTVNGRHFDSRQLTNPSRHLFFPTTDGTGRIPVARNPLNRRDGHGAQPYFGHIRATIARRRTRAQAEVRRIIDTVNATGQQSINKTFIQVWVSVQSILITLNYSLGSAVGSAMTEKPT
jgi:hypothetical protein